jgi:hypothetical protein
VVPIIYPAYDEDISNVSFKYKENTGSNKVPTERGRNITIKFKTRLKFFRSSTYDTFLNDFSEIYLESLGFKSYSSATSIL